MARGWESKAVEAQQDAAEQTRQKPPALSAGEIARRSAQDTLMLARTRAIADLQRACVPAHRAMLEQAIADLDRQLAELSQLRKS